MIDNIRTKVFADGARIDDIKELAKDPRIQGFTTNPTLMRKAGIADYEAFARDLLARRSPDQPISLEVFADDAGEMERQARKIAILGRERLRQDPGHQHQGRIHRPPSSGASPRTASSSTSRP